MNGCMDGVVSRLGDGCFGVVTEEGGEGVFEHVGVGWRAGCILRRYWKGELLVGRGGMGRVLLFLFSRWVCYYCCSVGELCVDTARRSICSSTSNFARCSTRIEAMQRTRDESSEKLDFREWKCMLFAAPGRLM